MQEGAFALIDCLGFKGIWSRFKEDPQQILNKLRKIAETVKEQIHSKDNIPKFLESAGLHSDPEKIICKTGFFSDTVFVGLQHIGEKVTGEKGEFYDALLVKTISSVVIRIIDLFIKEEPFLLMRGCITYGNFICEGEFYAGPAVDEAAEHMNKAEGAFVWLHKSAAKHYEKWNFVAEGMAANFTPPNTLNIEEADAYVKGPEVIYYPMPIKEKGHLSCFVLNVLSVYPDENDRRSVIDMKKR